MKLRTSLSLVFAGAAFLLLAACDVNVNAPASTATMQTTAASTPASTMAPADTSTPGSATATGASTPAPTDTQRGGTPTTAPTEASTVPPTITTDSKPTSSTSSQSPTSSAQAATAMPAPSGTIVDAVAGTPPPTQADIAPSPTTVVATSSGEAITALQAMAMLKSKALDIYPDARFALLVNSKPGQQKSLLGSSLGDPNINEPTPGGKGRNWTLVAVSPSRKGAMAFSMDGTAVDLVKEGTVTSDLLTQFSAPARSALDLSRLDLGAMKDTDAVAQAAGERGKTQQIGIALLAPDGLGIGPLPTPTSGGNSPQLAYELFSTDPVKQLFIFFDAFTGNIVLDSGV